MAQESSQSVFTGLKCGYSGCKFLCAKLGAMKLHASQEHGGKQSSISCTITQAFDDKGAACLREVNCKFIPVITINLQGTDVSSLRCSLGRGPFG